MKIKEIHLRWLFIPVVAVIMAMVLKHHANEELWLKLSVSMIFTSVYWYGAVFIMRYFRKLFPAIRLTPKRLTLTIAVLMAFIIIAGTIIRLILGYMSVDDIWDLSILFDHYWLNLAAALIVGSVYESVYFFSQWESAIHINEALKNQQIRTQFEVLQNQMSPHFLFNSLNTLTTLIAENQTIAIEFTQKMSDVYRYILQNKEKELVTLEEELDFAKAYIYLLQIRYPENLRAEFRIDDKFKSTHIAPLTVQMLIENAIKHNVISKAHPLTIEVYIENGYSIVVKNNLQKKQVIEKSTKTGLENIRKRYQYFGEAPIDIITTHKNYMVAIPLINIVKDTPQRIVLQ